MSGDRKTEAYVSVVVRDERTLDLLPCWWAWIVEATGDSQVGPIRATLPALSITDGGTADLERIDSQLTRSGYRRAADWSVTFLGFVAWVDVDAALESFAQLESLVSEEGGQW